MSLKEKLALLTLGYFFALVMLLIALVNVTDSAKGADLNLGLGIVGGIYAGLTVGIVLGGAVVVAGE